VGPLAAHDPANAQWQLDVAVSCAKLGTLDDEQPVEVRIGYFLRSKEILLKLKSCLAAAGESGLDRWLDTQLARLPPRS